MYYPKIVEKKRFVVPIHDAIPHLDFLRSDLNLPTMDVDAVLSVVLDLLFGNSGIFNDDIVDYLIEHNILYSGPGNNSFIADLILGRFHYVIESVRQALYAVLTPEWRVEGNNINILYHGLSKNDSIVFSFERYV